MFHDIFHRPQVNHTKGGHGLFVHVAYYYYMSDLLFTLEFRKEIQVAEWGDRYIPSLILDNKIGKKTV